MINKPISILHTGDIQIEVRNHQQRYDEFSFILKEIEKHINERKPEIYIIAGDVFEFCRPNDMERLLFINHLKMVSDNPEVKEIIITYGNHDTDQKKASNFFKHKGEDLPAENSLDSIVEAVDNPKIQLLKSSKMYQSLVHDDLVYLNWSQKTKHSDVIKESYNPVDNIGELPKDKTLVTIYHDPVQGCKQWDGNEMKAAQKSSGMDAFHTPTILAGDIHIPQIISCDGKNLIYCGSPVARNFGEGDYYKDGKLTQGNAYLHTVNFGILQPDGTLTNQEFIRIQQYRTYATYDITTKQIPEDWNHLNWEIAHPGLYETLVKVKLPSATETFLKAEPDIIDAIKKQNPNIISDIVFFYGKAIDDDDEMQVLQSSDLEKLITEEKIVEVASDYIQKQVQKSASIIPEDKDKVIKVVTDIFVREMKNFCNDIVSNHITFQKIRIDNFMSFGSGVLVSIEELGGLIKLTGGNGVGKTTFYNAIKWVLTGFISKDQNKVKKNENNLLIFNDYRWSTDETSVALKLRINGNVAIVARKATREWKKNATEEQKQSKEWKKYISGTSQSVTIQIGEDMLQSEKAEEWLSNIFGGLENLERIVFPNQFTLKNFVCSDPGRLCEEVLNHIGMNFFERMESAYETVRKDSLSSLAKPSQTIDTLKQLIAEGELKHKELEEQFDNIGSDIGAIDMNLYSAEETIKELNGKKHPGITEESINAESLSIQQDEESITERFSKANVAEELLSTKINQTDITILEIGVETAQKELETAQTKVGEARVNVEKANASIQSNIQEIKIRTSEIDAAFKERESSLRLEISELGNQKIQAETELAACRTNQSNILKSTLDVIEQKLKEEIHSRNLKTAELNNYVGKANDLRHDIEKLQNSKVCPTCNRELDNDHLVHIQEQIIPLKSKLTETETKIQELKTDIESIETLEAELNKQHLDISENPSSITELMEEYSKEKPIKEHIDMILKSIASKNEILGSLDEERKHAIKTDSAISEMVKKHEQLKFNVTEAETEVTKAETEVTSKKEQLTVATNALAEYNKNIQNLEKVRSLKTSLESEQKALDIRKVTCSDNFKKLESNRELDKLIAEEQQTETELKKKLEELRQREQNIKVQVQSIKESKKRYEMDIENAVLYRVTEQGLKQYKTLLGKQGLPQHIFSMIRGLLNHRLNDLLEYMEFRLHFNQDNQLQMIDLSKPSNPIRTPMQMSGMQTVFTGLALIYVNRMCNNTFIFDELFIDEVSGQLNRGDELTYESQNYQEQLKKLLKRFTNLKVWIVDHVIEDMEEDFRLEVVPSNAGASIIKR